MAVSIIMPDFINNDIISLICVNSDIFILIILIKYVIIYIMILVHER